MLFSSNWVISLVSYTEAFLQSEQNYQIEIFEPDSYGEDKNRESVRDFERT